MYVTRLSEISYIVPSSRCCDSSGQCTKFYVKSFGVYGVLTHFPINFVYRSHVRSDQIFYMLTVNTPVCNSISTAL